MGATARTTNNASPSWRRPKRRKPAATAFSDPASDAALANLLIRDLRALIDAGLIHTAISADGAVRYCPISNARKDDEADGSA